jgi:hydroxymethylpyrimidine/phosphomethylpyrimidine kinase
MLANSAIVEAVAAAIEELDLPNVVVDPVMIATSGDRLLDEEGVRTLCTELLPRALVVTPNIPEAEVLGGRPIASADDAREAARRIHGMGPSAVIVKGGHAAGDIIVDLVFDGERFSELRTARVSTRHTHGTGCTFASAIAANLAIGHPLLDATARAQAYVVGAIRHGLSIGKGHGPLNHFWQA